MQRLLIGMVACAVTVGTVSAEDWFNFLGTYKGQGGQFASVVGPGPTPDSERLYASYLYEGSTFEVTSVDSKTGAFKVYRSPVEDEAGARCMTVGPDGNVYLGTLPGARLVKLDTRAETLVDLGRPSSTEKFIWSIAFAKDGRLYGGTYPGARLVRYDPATGVVEDLGRMDPVQQYARYVASSADGFVYIGIGTAKMNLVAYSTLTGEHREILPEKLRGAGTAMVYTGLDGVVYAVAADRHFRLQGWMATPISKDLATPRVATSRTRDGRTMTLEGNSLIVRDSKAPQGTKTPYAYLGRELPIFSLGAGPDGRIYASSELPARLLRLGEPGSQIEQLGDLGDGEVYRFHSFGGKVLMAAYACAAPLMAFDPVKPVQVSPPRNPSLVTFSGQDLSWRPQALVSGPSGRVYVGAIAGYGKLGGPLCEWEVGSGGVECWENVVPDQSISALTVWRTLLVAGTTIVGGPGSRPTQKSAKLILWNPEARKVVFQVEPVPGAISVENLVVAQGGLVYGIAGRKLFTFDVQKRVVSVVADLPFPGGTLPGAFSVGPDGRIWGVGAHPEAGIYAINPGNNRMTLVAKAPAPITAGFAIVGDYLYFASGPSAYSFRVSEPQTAPRK